MASFPQNMTVEKENLSQTFDLETEFGVDLSSEPRLRQEIGQAIIDRIRERCLNDNQDIWGRPLKSYDKSYVESDEFKDFGKSAGDINMQLTGDMLGGLESSDTPNSVTVSLESGQTPKGYRHQAGDKIKQRAWFGMSKKEMDKIRDEFSSDIERVKNQQQSERERQRSALDLVTAQLFQESQEQAFNDLLTVSFPDLTLDDLV